jgi:hypothetical protein
MNEILRSAAEARAAGPQYHARGLASRPTERRSGEDPGSFRGLVTQAAPKIRAAADAVDGAMEFSGLACRVDFGYEMYDAFGPYTEVVDPGCFSKSLSQSDLDVPLVLQHVDLRRVARTTIPAGQPGHLSLTETANGLECLAQLDPADADVAYIVPKIRAGLVTEMSFKFRITKGQWSPDWSEYHIQEVDIHRGDVAICGYGANPGTTAEVREDTLAAKIARADEEEARAAFDALTKRFSPMPARSFVVLDSDLT